MEGRRPCGAAPPGQDCVLQQRHYLQIEAPGVGNLDQRGLFRGAVIRAVIFRTPIALGNVSLRLEGELLWLAGDQQEWRCQVH